MQDLTNLYLYTELTEEEKKLILTSPEFLQFVDTSSKFVERALNETYDFMKDYTLGIDVDRQVDKQGRRDWLSK